MEKDTYLKYNSIGQIILGFIAFIGMGIVFFTHAFHTPILISFCFLAMWIITYRMLRRSIAEYLQVSKQNNKSKIEKK